MVRFMPWVKANDDDREHGVRQELMGQVNLVRIGAEFVRDAGQFMLTSGVLAQHPIAGSPIVRTVNGAVEAFVRSGCRPRTWLCVTWKASRAA